METVAAFEAEVEQFPWCFAGMLGSVIMGRCGVKGIVIMGEEGKPKIGEELRRKLRESVGAGRTVCWGGGEWIQDRNALVTEMKMGEKRVMVCEGGACREGLEWV